MKTNDKHTNTITKSLKRSLTCSEHVKLAVDQLLLRQLGEVVLSKRVPARHVGGVTDCTVAALRWWRDPI